MNQERIMQQGRLAELVRQAAALKIRIQGLKEQLRLKIIDFIKPEDLEGELIADLGLQLFNAYVEYRDIGREIKAIEKALGH